MGHFIYALSVYWGLKEVLLFLVVLGVLKLWKKDPWPTRLARSAFYASLLWTGFWTGLNLVDPNRFLLLPYFYAGLSVLTFVLRRRPRWSLSLFLLLTVFFEWQFTSVKKTVELKITPVLENEKSVQLFAPSHCLVQESAELAAYVKQKNFAEVTVVSELSYHYGVLAGYGKRLIDGKEFPAEHLWTRGNCPDSKDPALPRTYFGLRGFNF